MSDRTPRFVVVELLDDAPFDADVVAAEIAYAMEHVVKRAFAAYDDGFGHLIRPINTAIHTNEVKP